MRALVIEDDSLMRKMIVKIISDQYSDIQIIECEDGQIGMEEYDSGETYDFAIIDFEMPKANGLEVVSYIRKERGDKNIALLMCTSRHDKKTVISLLQAGASDYIAKPFEPKNVIAKIEKILKRAERLKSLRASVKNQPVSVASVPAISAVTKPVENQEQIKDSAQEDSGQDDVADDAEIEKTEKSSSLRHGNIGDDVIDDTDEEKVFVDITQVDDDSDAVQISEDEFM